MTATITETCYECSLDILKAASTPHGFVASSEFDHYHSIWARDSAITSLGAILVPDRDLLDTCRATIETLSEHQSDLGAIPAVYWPRDNYWNWAEMGAPDASSWFIIAAANYIRRTHDRAFARELWPSAQKAFLWLQYQDANNFGLIDSPEAGDWMDSTFNRGGKVLYNNCLFYEAARQVNWLARQLSEPMVVDAALIKQKINTLFWPTSYTNYSRMLDHVTYPPGADKDFHHPASIAAYRGATDDRRHYLSHVNYGRFADVCDVFANCLAILFGIADDEKAEVILRTLIERGAGDPYPVKTLLEPVTEENDEWGLWKRRAERYQDERWHNKPNEYHNGGIWPYIGGFYVATLVRGGKRKEAQVALEKLAEINLEGDFNEWHHGETGEPGGAPHQAWNAGAYVMAYKALAK